MAKSRAVQLYINGKARTKKMFRAVRVGIKSLTKSVFSLKTAFAGILIGGAGGMLAKSFLNVARETENYQVRLKVLLGSQKEGNRLFKEMADYASLVPFTLNDIMGSATALSGILKGGVDEISQWMPLIGDLAAATGLGIQQTTEQVSRMLSAGAASADLFRERGVLSMLGFQAGVSYSAEETRKQLMSEWQKTGSQFNGATKEMAKTWDGLMSMLSDAWFNFRKMVMDSGVFDGMKGAVQGVLDKIAQLKKEGKLEDMAKGFGDKIMSGMRVIFGALPGIVRGAIKAAELLVLSLSGFKQIKGLFDILLAQAAVWSAELINGLRSTFLTLLRAIDRIPGIDTTEEQSAYKADIAFGNFNIDHMKKNVEEQKVALGRIQIAQDETAASFDEMATDAAAAVKKITDGAINGLISAQETLGETTVKSSKEQVSAIDDITSAVKRRIAAEEQLNAEKGKSGGTFNVASFSNALDDEEDK